MILKGKKMYSTLTGKSKAIKKIGKRIREIAASDDHVVVIGERGTGRSYVASGIHIASFGEDSGIPITTLKIASLSDTELDRALYGPNSADVGAQSLERHFQTENHDGGTLVVEDLDIASYKNQSKIYNLIRNLNGQISRDEEPLRRYRIIVTVNESLDHLIQKNEILDELAKILTSFQSITIPPLRERKDDIPWLVQEFVTDACREIGIEEPVIDINSLSLLVDQQWKGNIRELKMIINRSVLFSTNGTFVLPREIVDSSAKATRLLESVLTGSGGEINGSLDLIERGLIGTTLQRFEFNLSKTAAFLGMTEQTLVQRVHALGIRRE
jgi:DNA-binding NtrC family response regulator